MLVAIVAIAIVRRLMLACSRGKAVAVRER